jgi:hypothetical protein
VDLLEGIGDMVVLFADDDLLDGDAVSSSHGKVGEGSEDGDNRGDGVVETLRLVDELVDVTETPQRCNLRVEPSMIEQ